jgi:Reverse transcriptase (RNA-dependent DNA polymerase)
MFYKHHIQASGLARGAERHPPSVGVDRLGVLNAATPTEMVEVFHMLRSGKAAGVDKVNVDFFASAKAMSRDAIVYVFAKPLAELMSVLLVDGVQVPQSWKTKCIHPIYKLGDRNLAANYRPVAVSTSFYRILTSLIYKRLMEAAPHITPMHGPPGLFLPQQFAFRPQLSVLHAQFALHTCMDWARVNKKPLAVVKLDIEKAYDTVNRRLLWNTLCRAGIPWQVVHFVRGLYHDAHYVVFVNGVLSDAFLSNIGLQQGCALSPLLYNIYIREALLAIGERCRSVGVPLGEQSCTYINYADDINGTIVDPKNVESFLSVVEEELGKLHQRINREKSKILLVRRSQRQTPTHLAHVPVVKELRILGVTFYSSGQLAGNVGIRVKQADSKRKAIYVKSKMLGADKDSIIMLHLLNAHLKPTLLFGDAIWGCHQGARGTYMVDGDPLKHPLQHAFNPLLRFALGVSGQTGTWMCLMLSGHVPVRDYIVLDFCRFWNNLLRVTAENPLIECCIHAQVEMMGQSEVLCWLRLWDDIMQALVPSVVEGVLQGQHVMPIQVVQESLASSHTNLLHSLGDPMDYACEHRCTAMHFRVFDLAREWGKRPLHLSWVLPCHVRKVWTQFLIANAPIPSRAARFHRVPYAQRTCAKCDSRDIATEDHVLLQCPITSTVRNKFQSELGLHGVRDIKELLHSNVSKPASAWSVWEALSAYNA